MKEKFNKNHQIRVFLENEPKIDQITAIFILIRLFDVFDAECAKIMAQTIKKLSEPEQILAISQIHHILSQDLNYPLQK